MKAKSNKDLVWVLLLICLLAFYLGIKDGKSDKQVVKEKQSVLMIETINI